MGEAERGRTFVAIANIEARTLEEGKAEQEIKEEFIETKFHERLDLELPNIKKVKEEVKIECKEEYIEQNFNDKVPIELETIKKEGTITRKVKDEVKIECKEEYLEQNFHDKVPIGLKIIKRETKNPKDEKKRNSSNLCSMKIW